VAHSEHRNACRKKYIQERFYVLLYEHTFSLINFFVHNLEHFQTTFADLIQGMSIIFIVQLPNFHVLREVQTRHVS